LFAKLYIRYIYVFSLLTFSQTYRHKKKYRSGTGIKVKIGIDIENV